MVVRSLAAAPPRSPPPHWSSDRCLSHATAADLCSTAARAASTPASDGRLPPSSARALLPADLAPAAAPAAFAAARRRRRRRSAPAYPRCLAVQRCSPTRSRSPHTTTRPRPPCRLRQSPALEGRPCCPSALLVVCMQQPEQCWVVRAAVDALRRHPLCPLSPPARHQPERLPPPPSRSPRQQQQQQPSPGLRVDVSSAEGGWYR